MQRMQNIRVAPGQGGSRRLLTSILVDLLVNPAPVILDVGPEPGHHGVPGTERGPGHVKHGGGVVWKIRVENV